MATNAWINRGSHSKQTLFFPYFPTADAALEQRVSATPADRVDILFVNPPAPDGGIWIRSQHRVGRRSREGMVWPQVSLAQLAALFPERRVVIIDAIAQRLGWSEFERCLDITRPRYYVTQLTGPTLQNDMYGVFLAKARGAMTIAFGTHVTPMPLATLKAFPCLDYALQGEPELTLRELLDTLDAPLQIPSGTSAEDWWPDVHPGFAQRLYYLYTGSDPGWKPAWTQSANTNERLLHIKGLVWRHSQEIVINSPRPFISDLDLLPMPRHDLLPLKRYQAPLVGGPYAFIVTSRGCPAGCRFCIKHVSYGQSVRWRSPENIIEEISYLVSLGVRDIHMYADLFTVNRDHVISLCEGIRREKLPIRWTCNSRVDFVDEEMLRAMAQSGCWMISWGIESGSEEMLRRMHKGTTLAMVEQALRWAKQAGIKNWGYFIIGLPGETEDTIRQTIAFAKRLPLDLALFHIAAPHPGTPFFFEVVENGWFRSGTRWEQVDMDRSTVLDYPSLRAEDIERWARCAFREWAFRPRPIGTYLKMLLTKPSLWPTAFRIGIESLGWAKD